MTTTCEPRAQAIQCPHCKSSWFNTRNDGTHRCKNCGHGYTTAEGISRKPKRGKTESGSGVIAGKIVVGRGAYWGAGY